MIFFEGLYFSKKLNMKNFNIKTRTIKSLKEEEVPSGTKWGIGWSSAPPTLLNLSRPAERILNALPRWTAIDRFWWNQLASLGSPVISTRHRPIALMITPVDSPYTPIVSTAIGSNWYASARTAYLRRLRSSALFAAMPASIADLFKCTPAKVSTPVQSQTKLLQPLNGKTVMPSGYLSPLSNQGGSKTDGRRWYGAII